MRHLLLTIAAIGMLTGADEPRKAAEKGDREALQGTWTMVSVTVDGDGGSQNRDFSARLVVEGDRFTPTVDGVKIPCLFKLDPSQTPKAIDLTYTSGDLEGMTVKGIYKLQGDTFVMCRTLRPKDERPTEFASDSGSKLVLVTWSRSKP